MIREKPLAGVRVLEMAAYIAGPYCCTLMAEFGAEVIKIELPGVGPPRLNRQISLLA